MWRRAWVNGVDLFGERWWPETYRIVQNEGRGLITQGTREWVNYQVTAALTPHMVQAVGIGARVQGMRRYYALLLCRPGQVRLVKVLDGETVLAETDFSWYFGATYTLSLQVNGAQLRAFVDDKLLFEVEDTGPLLTGGGVALVCEEGRVAAEGVTVQPIR